MTVRVIAYDYEEPYPSPHPENFWHIYDTDMMDGTDGGEVTITAPDTPEMHDAIKRITDAIEDAYTLARSLRLEADQRRL